MKSSINMLNHILFSSSIPLFGYSVFAGKSTFFFCMAGTALLASVCCIIRWRTQKLTTFIIGHLLLLLSPFLVSLIIALPGWYIAIWILLVLYSAILGLFPQAAYLDVPGYFYVGTEVVFYIMFHVLQCAQMVKVISLITVLLLFLLYLLYDNLVHMDEFIRTSSIAMELEEARMKRVNTRFSFFYAGILGIILTVFGFACVEELREKFWSYIRSGLVFLTGLLFWSRGKQPEEQPQKDKEEIVENVEELLQMEEAGATTKMIGRIIHILIFLAMVTLVIIGLIRLIRFWRKHFYDKRQDEPQEIRENLMKRERVLKKNPTHFFEKFEQNPSKRIRRIYKKNMKRFQKKKRMSFRYMAPDEQVQVLKEEGLPEEIVTQVKVLYEKARYSAEEVTEKDAARFRSMI